MKLFTTLLATALFTAVPLFPQTPDAASEQQSASSNLIERGKYLVEGASQCADCHTPRNQKGGFLRDKWLRGSLIMFKPTVPVPGWMGFAPPIAGLPGWTDEQAITFLTTGKKLNGTLANAPMPAFRFNREDAAAITAYLRSLGAESASTGKPSSK